MKENSKKVVSICLSTLLLTNTLGPATLPFLGTSSAIAEEVSTVTTSTVTDSSVVASLEEGTYYGNQQVSLGISPESQSYGYTIKYSFGALSNPSTSYTGPISINGDKVLKFAAYDSAGNIVGNVVTKTYTILPILETSKPGGAYNTSLTIQLQDNVVDYWIWYTLDGSDPVPGNLGTIQNVSSGFTLSNEGTYKLKFASFLKTSTGWVQKGNPSQVIEYVIDKTVSAPTVQTIAYKDRVIKGTGEPGASVTAKAKIDGISQVIGNATADATGKFDINLTQDYAIGTEISITQTDIAKNTSTAATLVVGDLISNVIIPQDYYNLNSAFSINYSLSKPAYITADIFQGDQLIKRIVNNSYKSNTTIVNTATWDGRNTSGLKVLPGVYTYKINAKDASGNVIAAEKSGNFTASKAPIISNNTVTSDSSLGIDIDKISYVLDIPSKVNVGIYDSRGTLIKGYTNDQPKGTNSVEWTTTGIGDGVYTYRINAVDAQTGSFNAAQRIGTIIIDSSNVGVTNITPVSNPDNTYIYDLGRGSMSIGYTLSEDAYVTVEIYKGDQLVRTIPKVKKYVGSNTTLWDGKILASDNTLTTAPADINYSYKIIAEEVGTTDPTKPDITTTDKVTFKVSKTPVITVKSVTDINTTNNKSILTYDLGTAPTGTARLTVGIYNKQGLLVKEYVTNAQGSATGLIAEWNGTDNSSVPEGGNPVGDGVYTYKISAVDNTAQLASLIKTGTINVARQDVCITNITPESTSDNPYIFDLGKGSMNIGYTLSEDANVIVEIKQGDTVKRTIDLGRKYTGSYNLTWDGKIVSGTSLVMAAAGDYNLVIKANDGKEVSSNPVSFKVSKTPVITVKSVTDINTANKTAALTYDLSTAPTGTAKVTVGIYNKQGVLIKEYVTDKQGDALNLTTVWDGTDNSINPIPVGDGVYIYKISAVDNTAQLPSLVKSGSINVERADLTITDITPASTNENPFIYDLGKGSMSIGYTLSEDANVTVEIREGDIVKRTIDLGNKYAGINTLLWDGKINSNGILVQAPVGDYNFVIKVNDGTMVNPISSTPVNFKVSKTPVITVKSVTDITTTNNTATLTYDLSTATNGTAKVTVGIYNKQGILIKEYVTEKQGEATNLTRVWDGTDNSSIPIPVGDGIYTYKISAIDDKAQLPSIVKSGSITVERAIPEISIVTLSQNPFNTSNGSLSIGYGLSEDTKVTIKIYDSANQLVKTLASGLTKSAGLNYVNWNGKDNYDNYVPAGTYNYTIEGADISGNPAKTISDKVVVSATPNISNVNVEANFVFNGTNSTPINFSLSRKSKVNVKITDKYGNLVKTIFDQTVEAGTYAPTWNGSAGEQTIQTVPLPVVAPGAYTYTITAVDNTVDSFTKTYKGTVNVLPYIFAENFNTHNGTDYQGINVGFNLGTMKISDLKKVEVSLYNNDTLLVTNTTNDKFLTLPDTEKQHSTPFIIHNGTYVEEYWNLNVGNYNWLDSVKPTKALITITDQNGKTYKMENSLLDESTAKFDELIPKTYTGEAALPYVVAENFNTHGGTEGDYKGINVGFRLESLNVSDLSKVEVSLYNGEALIVTNTSNDKLLALDDTIKQLSTPFIVTLGSYVEEYWTLGEHTWASTEKPTKAQIKITDKKGNVYTIENNSLSEDTILFNDLFSPFSQQ